MSLRGQYLDDDRPEIRRWPTYFGITALLVVLVVVLAGGIIWYDSTKTDSFAIASARQTIKEAEKKVIDRIKLLYDPMFAIVGVASLVPEITTTTITDNVPARAIMLRALRIYPQILSIYVGFDNGNFLMVTRITGPAAGLRQTLQAPQSALYAVELIGPDASGERKVRWLFLGEEGDELGSREPAPTDFDPRERPWYRPAKESNNVEHSELYIFAATGEPGFTVSRSFQGPTPGVMGADLAAAELDSFLDDQRMTPSGTAFIFTGSDEIVAMPDRALIAKAAHSNREATSAPPKLADLQDPVISGLVAEFEAEKRIGAKVYRVAGRTYIGRVAEIPAHYGRDQLLAIMVPVDEIIQPINEIRNQTLLYSIAFLAFALPLYITLIVVWIDRRLQRPTH
jgi:adenylate cyclase